MRSGQGLTGARHRWEVSAGSLDGWWPGGRGWAHSLGPGEAD